MRVRSAWELPEPAAVLIAALAVVLAAARGTAQRAPFPAFPLGLAVAAERGAPVVSEAWIDERVAHANALFAPAGVSFVVGARRALDARFAHLETRADRHALGAELAGDVINVFLVASLRDVDDPAQMRRGVHWRPVEPAGAHFVVVSSIAGPDVLAHELGHFFGNPHSPVRNDIMSYEHDEGVTPFFEPHELTRIRQHARRFRARGEIRE